MPPELTLESLALTLDSIQKTANNMQDKMERMKDNLPDGNHGAQTDEDKEKMEAQEKMEEEKKEALKGRRARRDAAIKAAQEMDDEDKKDAAIKAAMDYMNHDEKKSKYKGQDDDENKNEAQTDEEKEEHAAVASILKEKKFDYINKILTANKIFNPGEVKAIEKRLKKANISELEKEWTHVKPFVANVPNAPQEKPEPFIPYFASIMSPEEIDASQLNANSPDSAFAKLTTKELLEMAN